MRAIPLVWMRRVAWILFIEMLAITACMYIGVADGTVPSVLYFGFFFICALSFPNLPVAGWGVWKGGNLCKNRPTYLVAVGIHLLFAIAFWSILIADQDFDAPFAFGSAVTSLILTRAYSDARKLETPVE